MHSFTVFFFIFFSMYEKTALKNTNLKCYNILSMTVRKNMDRCSGEEILRLILLINAS